MSGSEPIYFTPENRDIVERIRNQEVEIHREQLIECLQNFTGGFVILSEGVVEAFILFRDFQNGSRYTKDMYIPLFCSRIASKKYGDMIMNKIMDFAHQHSYYRCIFLDSLPELVNWYCKLGFEILKIVYDDNSHRKKMIHMMIGYEKLKLICVSS